MIQTGHNNRSPVVLHTRVVTGTGGGPDKTILNSPRFLRQFGYEGVCAYMHPPRDPGFEEIKGCADKLGAPLRSVPDRGPLDPRVLRRLWRICRDENVAIWHGHDYKSNLAGLLLRRFWPMRLVATVHGWVEHTARTPLYYWVDRQCLRRCEQVVCVSEDLRRKCVENGVDADRCHLIENAIDTEVWRRRLSTAEAKERLGFPADQFLIGTVGRLSDEKGFDLLIRAVAHLAGDGRDVALAIAGEGSQRRELEVLIEKQQKPERFRLLGHRSDIVEFYQAMDVFVSSSLREGLPNVLLEAMALEVPVIATRIAGVPALIQDGRNGLLVRAGSCGELTAAIRKLEEQSSFRTKLTNGGRSTIEARYCFAKRMQKVCRIYEKLLGPADHRDDVETCSKSG